MVTGWCKTRPFPLANMEAMCQRAGQEEAIRLFLVKRVVEGAALRTMLTMVVKNAGVIQRDVCRL